MEKVIKIYSIVVNPHYRNRGIGTNMFGRIKSFAYENNISKVIADTVPISVEDFYKKQGMEKNELNKKFYLNEEAYDWVCIIDKTIDKNIPDWCNEVIKKVEEDRDLISWFDKKTGAVITRARIKIEEIENG